MSSERMEFEDVFWNRYWCTMNPTSALKTGGKDFLVLYKSKERHFREREEKMQDSKFSCRGSRKYSPLSKCKRTMGDNKVYPI